MLFSLDWLRESSALPSGVDADAVARALTARGLTVDAIADGPGGDRVLDVDIPANRPDCLGHLGLARELAAAFGKPLPGASGAAHGSGPASIEEDTKALQEIVSRIARVEIASPALCPRYTARLVRGVRVAPSAPAVVRRLEACGLRSRNNVVDASNLVLLELGHPVHFFDAARVRGERPGDPPFVRVRTARPGETLVTLDGVERRLDPDMLVIADAERAIALAGVIGGADSEITESTRDVLIEAAVFAPRSVRATARRLGLSTDASFRFERGVDPEGVRAAQNLALRLLVELGGGEPVPGLVDVYPSPVPGRGLRLRTQSVARLLGFVPDPGTVEAALAAVGLAPQRTTDGFEVRVPTWRVDLEREADLVEEVARHVGYDRIPASVGTAPAQAPPEPRALGEHARDGLAALGFHESFGYAMIADGEDDPFVPAEAQPAAVLANPLAEPMRRLRRSLLGGLVRAAETNLRRGVRDVRLFEVGHVFFPRAGGFPFEPAHVGLVWSGAARPRSWSRPDEPVEVWDVLGVVEHVIEALRPGLGLERTTAGPAGLHPGRRASWISSAGATVARAGALHPELARELDQELFLAEIDLDALAALPRETARAHPLPRFPAVTRDLSLVIGAATGYADLRRLLERVPAPAPVRFEPVDRYVGPPLGAGEVSLSIRFTLQPFERTLTDAETEAYRQALVEALQSGAGVSLRGT